MHTFIRDSAGRLVIRYWVRDYDGNVTLWAPEAWALRDRTLGLVRVDEHGNTIESDDASDVLNV